MRFTLVFRPFFAWGFWLSAILIASFAACKTSAPAETDPPTVLPADGVLAPADDTPSSVASGEVPTVTNGPMNVWPPQEELILSLQTTPCLGTCPVYRLEVFRDGTMRYQGSQFTERIGTYRGKLDLKRLDGIFKQAEAISFAALEDVYPTGNMRIMDLPSSIMYLRTASWQKQVVSRRYANPDVEGEQVIVDSLRELQVLMDALLDDAVLELVGEGRQD